MLPIRIIGHLKYLVNTQPKLLVGIILAYVTMDAFANSNIHNASALFAMFNLVLTITLLPLLFIVYVYPVVRRTITSEQPGWLQSLEAMANNNEVTFKANGIYKLYDAHVNNMHIRENAWLNNLKYAKESTNSSDQILIRTFLALAFPYLWPFATSTTIEIKTKVKLPHILFDSYLSSVGGIRPLDMLALEQSDQVYKLANCGIYVQKGLKQEAYEILTPDVIEIVNSKLAIFDMEFSGNTIVLTLDHLIINETEQALLREALDGVDQILKKVSGFRYPKDKPKPEALLESNAIRKQAALRVIIGIIILFVIYQIISVAAYVVTN